LNKPSSSNSSPYTNVISIRYLLQSNSNWLRDSKFKNGRTKFRYPTSSSSSILIGRWSRPSWIFQIEDRESVSATNTQNNTHRKFKKKTAEVVDKLARRKLNRFYHLSYFSLYFYGEFTISTEIKFKFRFPFCDINTSFYQVNCD
jgi:hypothetical protein